MQGRTPQVPVVELGAERGVRSSAEWGRGEGLALAWAAPLPLKILTGRLWAASGTEHSSYIYMLLFPVAPAPSKWGWGPPALVGCTLWKGEDGALPALVLPPC